MGCIHSILGGRAILTSWIGRGSLRALFLLLTGLSPCPPFITFTSSFVFCKWKSKRCFLPQSLAERLTVASYGPLFISFCLVLNDQLLSAMCWSQNGTEQMRTRVQASEIPSCAWPLAGWTLSNHQTWSSGLQPSVTKSSPAFWPTRSGFVGPDAPQAWASARSSVASLPAATVAVSYPSWHMVPDFN